jgi:hypothetical protein
VNRRFWSVFLLISAFGCRGLSRTTFQPVETASRAIEADLDRKPEPKAELTHYSELLNACAGALDGARERVRTPREQAVLGEYEAALKALTDIGLIWEERRRRGTELLPLREEAVGRLVREYDLPVNTNEPPSIYATEAVAAARDAARAHLRAARMALGLEL